MSFSTTVVLLGECIEQMNKLKQHSEIEKELHDHKFEKLESENNSYKKEIESLNEEIQSYKTRENVFYIQRDELFEEIAVLKRRVGELENSPKRPKL